MGDFIGCADVWLRDYERLKSLDLDDGRKEIIYDIMVNSIGFEDKRTILDELINTSYSELEKLQQEYRDYWERVREKRSKTMGILAY